MGKSQREKGKRFEREVARRFRDVLPGYDVRRGFQSRRGSDAPDVDVPKFWVEAKVGARTNPRAALAQAIEATDGRIPVAVCKDDRKDPVVMMRMDDFLDFVLDWWSRGGGE